MNSMPEDVPLRQHSRLDCIDALRGLVMIFMCLDHTREFFFDQRVYPEDLSQPTPLLFATRWITHFCAPTFIFLAGVSAFLFQQKTSSRLRLSGFLLTRGVWLIVLEFTVVHFGWLQTFSDFPFMFIVIAAIGASMIALSGLIWLPFPVLCSTGISIVVLHNCLDQFAPDTAEESNLFWILFHTGGSLQTVRTAIGYPILAWIGVICCGYSFGRVMLFPRPVRVRVTLALGVACTVLFVGLRWINVYGDPSPRLIGVSFPVSLMSFLKCSKYPPSLCYLLMTLGPMLTVLSLFDRTTDGIKGSARPSFRGPLLDFGRVPLFFYIVHLYLISCSCRLLYGIVKGEFVSSLVISFRFQDRFDEYPEFYGLPLWVTYPAWIVMLLILWPLCRWYGRVKRRSKNPLLKYL